MRMPIDMPAALRLSSDPIYAFAPTPGSLASQGIFDILPIPGISDGIKCAACCAGKAGFGACLARCLVTHQACDGGVSNCTPC